MALAASKTVACSRPQQALRYVPSRRVPARPLREVSKLVCQAQKAQFSSFEDMLASSDVPILVDFFAEWCGPCQMLSPTLQSVSQRLKGQIKIVKINTEKYPAIASQHKIQALPTLVLFKKGQAVDRIEGLLNEQQLVDRLNYFLATP
uniref:Thioredoxin domain-containing protein n=1 Tax=Chlamydomonas leiostraca TaxID=1034604 RepID=A0A7S0S1S1_9CHLO|mmetsp:Transcript_37826/g.95668  ORF Transcript_37826/g.95668 Transcript_37826/m.95668 type:complete len:148 (+) Transcript_37826:83-526(+)